MIRLEELRLVPLHGTGEGRVGRFLGSVLLVSVETEAVGAAALLELCRDHSESGASPSALVERVTSLLARSIAGSVPGFCLLVQLDGSARAIVNGDAQLTIGADNPAPRIVHGGPSSWTTVDIDSGAYLSATLTSVPLGTIDSLVDLRRGVSSGTGFVLIARGTPAASLAAPLQMTPELEPVAVLVAPTPAAPTPEPADARPSPPPQPPPPPPPFPPPPVVAEPPREPVFQLVDLRQPAPSPLPLPPPPPSLPLVGQPAETDDHPHVRGLNCARGHFNDPRAHYCAVCGLQMGQASFVLVDGQRPPLGVLVFDNGESHSLLTDLIIGRDPSADTAVQLGRARAAIPAGDVSGLSRVHAEVRLVDWEVQLIDRQSTNGTFTWDVERATWQRLAPNTPFALVPGMQIACGPRTAVFESTLRTG